MMQHLKERTNNISQMGNDRNLTRETNNDLYLQNKNLLDQEKVLQKQVECLTSLLGASLADQKLIKQSLEKQEHEIRILSFVNEMNLYRKLMTTDGHKDICDFRPNKDSPPTWKDKLFMDECKVSFEEGKIERQDKKKCKKTKSLDVNNNVLFESPETASANRLDKKI